MRPIILEVSSDRGDSIAIHADDLTLSLPARNADQAIRAARSLTKGLLENHYPPGQLEQSIREFAAHP
jgi:hypothetical protein